MATICDLSLGGKRRPDIKYPCDWEYKVIIPHNDDINNPLEDVFKGKEYKVKKSHDSKNGTYTSYNVNTLVNSDDERDVIFQALKAHKVVKYVL